jgi:hypothetical protein
MVFMILDTFLFHLPLGIGKRHAQVAVAVERGEFGCEDFRGD